MGCRAGELSSFTRGSNAPVWSLMCTLDGYGANFGVSPGVPLFLCPLEDHAIGAEPVGTNGQGCKPQTRASLQGSSHGDTSCCRCCSARERGKNIENKQTL